MYKIKQIPEDFIVKEINDININDNGKFAYFLLKKRNYNTLRAVQQISKKLKINEKNIEFAGNKDKNAVTEQIISIYKGSKSIQNIKIKDIELEYLGQSNEKVFLGNLKGNKFEITLRNLNNKDINKLKEKIENQVLMPNYFGQQRFSTYNHLIGKAIVKKNFKEAVNLILESNSDFNEKIKGHLKTRENRRFSVPQKSEGFFRERKNDFVGALKIIPLKLLKLYVHSYQSLIFNKTLEQLTKNRIKIEKIPVVGFGTEFENKEIEIMIKKILEKEKITLRDFIVRQIPELSMEGNERNTFIKVNDFEITKQNKDKLNQNKEKLKLKFSLPKGCYATVLVDYLLN